MIKFNTFEKDYIYDLSEVLHLFFDDADIGGKEFELTIKHVSDEEPFTRRDKFSIGDMVAETQMPMPANGDILDIKRARKRSMKMCLYKLLKQYTGKRQPWGALTGIRPSRLLYEGIEQGLTPNEAVERLIDEFDVSPERAGLLYEIYEAQKGLREPDKNEFDLYIGIPFCLSRCTYCSFASMELGKGELVEPYVKALLREIHMMSETAYHMGLRPRACYIGGGTPTAIPVEQLRKIIRAVKIAFPYSKEFTVEAGRPDTLDMPMLEMLKAEGATRISVNPQTFKNETLEVIGRRHTSEDIYKAFAMAREEGFTDINMDVIAALPGESLADFEHTINELIRLAPECATVHSLAIKRSSKLYERMVNGGFSVPDDTEAGEMLHYARERLTAAGYAPYYLYRQKYMAGNLENVGYSLPGKQCLYNIGNMEETACVMALGAGSISKWLFDRRLRIERSPNLRNVEEYIRRVDEMAGRKRRLMRS